jgi:hypothetical protein
MIRKNPNIVDLAPPLKGVHLVHLLMSVLGEKVLSNKFFWHTNYLE